MNTTTRRHPRSLAEAFPDERAGWLEHHRSPFREFVTYAGFIGFVLFLLFGLHLVARFA